MNTKRKRKKSCKKLFINIFLLTFNFVFVFVSESSSQQPSVLVSDQTSTNNQTRNSSVSKIQSDSVNEKVFNSDKIVKTNNDKLLNDNPNDSIEENQPKNSSSNETHVIVHTSNQFNSNILNNSNSKNCNQTSALNSSESSNYLSAGNYSNSNPNLNSSSNYPSDYSSQIYGDSDIYNWPFDLSRNSGVPRQRIPEISKNTFEDLNYPSNQLIDPHYANRHYYNLNHHITNPTMKGNSSDMCLTNLSSSASPVNSSIHEYHINNMSQFDYYDNNNNQSIHNHNHINDTLNDVTAIILKEENCSLVEDASDNSGNYTQLTPVSANELHLHDIKNYSTVHHPYHHSTSSADSPSPVFAHNEFDNGMNFHRNGNIMYAPIGSNEQSPLLHPQAYENLSHPVSPR